MVVDIYVNGQKIAKGTKYDYTDKRSNERTKTFDGMDTTPDEFPDISVSVEKVDKYSNADIVLAEAMDGSIDGFPITLVDRIGKDTITAYFTGCFLSQRKVSRDPKKKRVTSFDFDATTVKEEYSNS